MTRISVVGVIDGAHLCFSRDVRDEFGIRRRKERSLKSPMSDTHDIKAIYKGHVNYKINVLFIQNIIFLILLLYHGTNEPGKFFVESRIIPCMRKKKNFPLSLTRSYFHCIKHRFGT